MKLVIDIPEEEYNLMKTQVVFGNTNPLKMRIANGTPLPKIRAEIRKKMAFNSFNEGYVLYDDIIAVLDKYNIESEEKE